jgi:quercetin dioxygenase-like cupin family protein
MSTRSKLASGVEANHDVPATGTRCGRECSGGWNSVGSGVFLAVTFIAMAAEITAPGTGEGSLVTVDYLTDDSFTSSGPRAYFKYRDLNMGESSAGLVRGQEVRAIQSVDNTNDASTRWHYHTYGAQYIYVLEGWVDLALPGGVIERVTAGTFVSIAGGQIHNEVAISGDFRALEITLPASDFDTVGVDDPDA